MALGIKEVLGENPSIEKSDFCNTVPLVCDFFNGLASNLDPTLDD
jgi:hypothetical protein